MAAGRGAELLRPPSSSGRATLLELFFDLAFVVALARVSQRFVALADDAVWALVTGLGHTLPVSPVGREEGGERDAEA